MDVIATSFRSPKMLRNDHMSSLTIAILTVGATSSPVSQSKADENPQQADPRQPLSPHGSAFPSPGTNLQPLLSSTTRHTLRSAGLIHRPKNRAASATSAASAERHCHIGLNRRLKRQATFPLRLAPSLAAIYGIWKS